VSCLAVVSLQQGLIARHYFDVATYNS